MPLTEYGNISPRTAAFAAAELLKRGLPYLCLEKFGQSKSLPGNNSMTMKFRRYNSLAVATTPLTEGVTPASKRMTATDVTATLYQYGDIVEITDVIADTHEDPVLQEAIAVCGEQAAKTVEIIRYNILKACSNVFYAASVAARTDVTDAISRATQRKVIRAMERQEASRITNVVRSTPAFNTENILPAFIALGHVDLTTDIRTMDGFVGVQDYGAVTPFETEIGACEDVRYLKSTIFTAYPDGGGTVTGHVSTAGSKADVYPVLYIGKDAYGIIALKGKYAITPSVMNPNTISKSDPLGQRGFVSWKTMQTAVILNDSWMSVLEVACSG
jgi:N4-gp56 family major capsid protein